MQQVGHYIKLFHFGKLFSYGISTKKIFNIYLIFI